MSFHSSLSLAEARDVFQEEIGACRGVVSDVYDDGERLFMRSLLPYLEEVRTRDALQGGVALKGAAGRVSLYPYLFRKVCSNGAIMARAICGPYVVDLGEDSLDQAERALREGVRQCCEPEVFSGAVEGVRASLHAEFDVGLTMLSFLSRMPASVRTEVLRRFFDEGDSSQFGFMNAVTATARDASDPALRWELEEVGGEVAAGARPRRPLTTARARADRRQAAAV